jgi:oligosaccharide reducing-end xylanase
MKTLTHFAILCACCCALAAAPQAAPAGKPAPRKAARKAAAAPRQPAYKGAAVTGRYRNLFLEAGHSEKEINARINAAFQQLFHGDKDTQTLYYETGSNENGPLAYLTDIKHKDIRSEGMSYGMMISVQMNKKAEFDALWNWSMTYMYHASPTHPGYGFFSWQMRPDGKPMDESPAPDGEEYYAMALYFAANRWGNGTGIYNYKAAADRLLSDMKNRAEITGPTIRRPETDYAEFNPEFKMVRFTPNKVRADHTDPSYHLPAFYELWARWAPVADRPFWAEAAKASRDFFQKATNPKTGLAPDYANFDGTPVVNAFNKRASTFSFDSCRTAMNWSVDWNWWAADPRERELSDRIQAFFESQGMDTYVNQFSLDGVPYGTMHATGLAGTNAVASLAAADPVRSKKFVEALWKAEIPSGIERYYEGTLYMMSMLHVSGQFRAIMPKTK